ncbi:hypothetical protein XENOCAPTIV_029802 [Xenoophorus captivus]|uniref:Uncharacterized protein n=1 Tax=Xenoophorus captivus TaxID=1517983 RepID=A0ABV0RNB0_9TELE
MTSTTDFDNVEITQQYSRINTRFDLCDEELDNDNSSARLFERSRIKALAASALHSLFEKCVSVWISVMISHTLIQQLSPDTDPRTLRVTGITCAFPECPQSDRSGQLP